ncbi:hypothetical protein Vadar_001565 [Vaccinium darrowii]|uniref:Uncharacterized protein n=1 Tax=Vaccinium darrowii TaxID=229202 RepID=A0ACB7YSD3_9ERIC|nr:hypothetical protein Vadar_001565 [Vaccinium darrowii]
MLDDMRDVNVGNWEWESGTFPESGVTIDDTDMIQGLGSNLFEDDSDSDANYDHFSDSDYGFTDEDDRLYDENVDVNTTLPSNFLERDDRMFDSDSEEYPDSDDGFSSLNETEDEDDSRTKKTHVFKPIKGKEEPVFCEGMLFRNRAQFAGAIRHHSILQGKQIRFTKNETTRVRAKCRVYVDPDNGKCKVECPWEIFASERKKGSKTLQVKKYNPNHNCGRIWNNKLMNSEWLSMMYFDEIRISPTLKVSEMMEKVRQEFKCNVSLSQCYRAKHKVLRKIEGSMDEQYAKLWDYCREIHRTNPDELGPKIHKKIEKIKERYGDYIIHPCGEGEFEARGFDGGQHTINLKTQTCSCRRWDLTGIPCEHAARVIVESGGQPEEYVSDWYSKHCFLTTYKNIMHPMNGPDMWEKSGKDPIKPPHFTRQPGRPRKARRREADELAKKTFKLSKRGVKMTCRKCGKQGHNSRTCKAPVTAFPRDPERGRGRGRRGRGRTTSAQDPTMMSS